jgi:hypothetical protein
LEDEGYRSSTSSLPVGIDCSREKIRFCMEELRTLEKSVGRREESMVGNGAMKRDVVSV